jgi:uncharacterized protein (DUF1800 family)
MASGKQRSPLWFRALAFGPPLLFGFVLQAQAAVKAPVLISNATSTRAVALESVTMQPEPFAPTPAISFGNDNRTRVAIFAMNLDLLSGEGASAFTADAEDASHRIYPLNVEYAGPVPSFEGIYMIIVRLDDALADVGDVLVRLNLHGVSSNRVRLGVGHVGGGPADDQGAAPTPAPPVPPSAPTLLTIEQYRNQFTDPSLAAGPDAVRFLEQATWGTNTAELTRVRSMGYAAWINDQFQQPISSYPSLPLYPFDFSIGCPTQTATCGSANYSMYPLQTRFLQRAATGGDQLRQRVAFSLHKMIVVSGNTIIWPSYMAPYFQKLDQDAFGNFRDVLYDMTLNPAMGVYLSMAGNSAVAPNENYAREIMQLFSIGVDKLNQDGTPVLDAQGNRVPSYDQATITNFARVFTGWNLGPNKQWIVNPTEQVPNFVDPMPLVNNRNTYDLGQKTLLDGVVLPACTNCTNTPNAQTYKLNELNLAINNLFNHSNTGPYLCTQLIHHFVTSNPSPPYVGRCSAVFADNGSGIRGDLKAVIRAILLDPEARGDQKTDPHYGHLRDAAQFTAGLLRAFNATSDYSLAGSWTTNSFLKDMGQDIFNPDTVFSYYPADFRLAGTNDFGPEFSILSTASALKRANFLNSLLFGNFGNGIPPSGPDRPIGTKLDYSAYQPQAGNPQQLVDALDTLMMHNAMTVPVKNTIVQTVTNIPSNNPALRTQTAIYLVATSPQYQVER